jgi:ABC-type uncharacterized transport system permease subunit
MTAANPTLVPASTEMGEADRRAQRSARIRGAVIAALGLVCFALATGSMDVNATFSFWLVTQGGEAFTIATSVGVLWILAGVASGLIGMAQMIRGASFPWRKSLILLVPLYIAAIVATLLDGKVANMTGVFAGTLEYAVPISLGAFAGILSERSGMLNIAIEGKFLIGACTAAIAASMAFSATGNQYIGVIVGVTTAMLAGIAVGFILAWLGIRHKVDQIIAGVVINIGALGITNFLFLRILSKNTWLNTPPTIEKIKVPILSDIPVLGPMVFSGSPFLYFTIATMLFLTYMLFKTRWGLRLRASGEKPSAAGTVGIDVIKIRYRSMILAGALAGLAGSYLSLSTAGSFQMGMSAGRGFIALAAVIFGAWHPIGAFGAALVFGFSDAIQSLMSILGVDVPPQLLNSVPYLVTIIVVAGVVGRVRGPAAAGQPYDQD